MGQNNNDKLDSRKELLKATEERVFRIRETVTDLEGRGTEGTFKKSHEETW